MYFSFLLVNYNTESHILQLLDDLSHQDYHANYFEVVIINNVQNNKLADLLATHHYPFSVRLFCAEYNIGFGRAMNLAASHATGEHLIIINPDISIKDTGFISKLAPKLLMDYGVITCQIMTGAKDRAVFYDYEFGQRLDLADGEIAWFLGALMIVQKRVFERLGGFDPDFFMYCEDEDLCLRVRQAGLPLIHLKELSVAHIGGVSEPSRAHRGYEFYQRWYGSRVLFAYKHYDSEVFKDILINTQAKAAKKMHLYRLLSTIPHPRLQKKLARWQALYDVCMRAKSEGGEWLKFR